MVCCVCYGVHQMILRARQDNYGSTERKKVVCFKFNSIMYHLWYRIQRKNTKKKVEQVSLWNCFDCFVCGGSGDNVTFCLYV